MYKMTEGRPLTGIIKFAIPLILGNLIQLLYTFVDTLIVGRSIGVNGLGALGLATNMMFLVVNFVQSFTTGTSIPLAQAYGAEDYQRVKRSMALNLALAVLMTLVITFISLLFLDPALEWMQTPQEIYQESRGYLLVIFGGLFAAVGLNLYTNLFRAIGDSRTPVIAFIISMILNIILDYCFVILIPGGLMGVAFATIVSQLVASAICYWVIRRDLPLLQVTVEDFKAPWQEWRDHLRLGIPFGTQASVIALGVLAISFKLNQLGPAAVAGYTTASKLDFMVIQILMSFGVAMATFVAQNYGAQNYDRILLGVRQAVILSVSVALIFGVFFFIFGGTIASNFATGSSVDELAHFANLYFRWTTPFYSLLAILFILRYSLQGLNDSVSSSMAGMMEFICRIFSVFVMSGWMAYESCALANPLAWLGSIAILYPAYRLKVKKLLKPL